MTDRKDFLASPVERQRIWATIGAECLKDGRLPWAAQAFRYANEADPPRTWPDDHPASVKSAEPWPKPGIVGKLFGRSLLKVLEWKARIA